MHLLHNRIEFRPFGMFCLDLNFMYGVSRFRTKAYAMSQESDIMSLIFLFVVGGSRVYILDYIDTVRFSTKITTEHPVECHSTVLIPSKNYTDFIFTDYGLRLHI